MSARSISSGRDHLARRGKRVKSGQPEKNPPCDVQASTRRRTHRGKRSASSWATMPPIDAPITSAASTPAALRIARASLAICRIEYGPLGTSLRPMPRLSKTMALYRDAREGSTRNHISCVKLRPMIRRMGGPLPCSFQYSFVPPLTAYGMEFLSTGGTGICSGRFRAATRVS
jgi:hypothetical protein